MVPDAVEHLAQLALTVRLVDQLDLGAHQIAGGRDHHEGVDRGGHADALDVAVADERVVDAHRHVRRG